MRLDTHVHTSPGSRCSRMHKHDLLRMSSGLGLEAVCITNHGDIADFEDISGMVQGGFSGTAVESPSRLEAWDVSGAAPSGLTVIPGVEISSPVGDFLIYSEDLDFLRGLEAAQQLPLRSQRPERTAVVWAHPFAGNGGGANASEDYIRKVVPQVDGIEVFNGNWPDDEASALARRIAAGYELAELGGSDAHRSEHLMRCWTEIDGRIASVANLITAILERGTAAAKL